ncbi:MAG: hypothetical protein WCC86_01570 [Methanoregula sp.]|uniref:hypothetical protein n=1 Tax=Methanoregula sp. TaxID=2052170 RepID=UPI003BB08A18
MTVDFKSSLNTPPRSRIALSSKTKKQIKELVGKCEHCETVNDPESLEIHQIGMLSHNPQRLDEDPMKILIVLCEEHALQAREGKILKSSLRSMTAKRSDKLKKALRALLQKADRTYEGSNVTKTHDPNRFSVGAFLSEKKDRHS